MNLSKHRISFFIFSSTIIIIGIIFIIMGGLKPGIDFTGGSTLTVKLPTHNSSEEMRNILIGTDFESSIIQNFGDNTFFVRTFDINDTQKADLLNILDSLTTEKNDLEVLSFDMISPLIARETVINSFWAVFAATVGIFIYIWCLKIIL